MKSICAFTLLILLQITGIAQEKHQSYLALLKKGEIDASTITPSGPKQAVLILQKFVQELRKNPEWRAKYAKETASPVPGPRPYDANMGITLDEYDILVASRDLWSWVQKKEGKLLFLGKGGTGMRIVGEGDFTIWNGLVIDQEKDTVQIAGKILTRQTTIIDHLGLGPLGDMKIHAWKFRSPEAAYTFRILIRSNDEATPILELQKAAFANGEHISTSQSVILLTL